MSYCLEDNGYVPVFFGDRIVSKRLWSQRSLDPVLLISRVFLAEGVHKNNPRGM
jgi:hypothetical protein